MTIKTAGIDLVNQGLDNAYRIRVLERIIEEITQINPNFLSQVKVNEIKEEAVIHLQKKYPEAGITKRN